MDTKLFDGLSVFLAVVEHRSFSVEQRSAPVCGETDEFSRTAG